MLTRLHIKNYQSHQDSVIELGPGVNVIVGESNAGKSACIRALNWPIANRPLGTGFIRTGQEEADVLLKETRSDGQEVSVERIRGKTKNEYVLNGDTEHPFTAFGSNPPEDVLQALNLREVNLQTQFAPYFLVFDSPGQVGAAIRQVTGMEKIDKVCDIIATRIRSVGGRIKDKEADLASVQEKLAVASRVDLEKLEALINQAENLEVRRDELTRTHQRLQRLVTELSSVQKGRIHLPEDRLKQISSTSTQQSEHLLQLQSSYRALNALIEGLRSACANRVSFPSNIDEILSRRETLVAQYNSMCTRLQSLFKVVEALEKCGKEGLGSSEAIAEAEVEKGQLMSKLTTCPWCTSLLTEDTKGHLLEHTNER